MLPISGADPSLYLASVGSASSLSAPARLTRFSSGRCFAPAWAFLFIHLPALIADRTL